MVDVNINLVAVLVAAIVNVVIGFVWYMIFAKPWMALTGKTEKDVKTEKKKMPLNTGITLGASLVLAYALSWIVDLAEVTTIAEGALAGLFVGVGVAAMTMLPNYVWPAKPMKLYFLDSSEVVLGIVVMGIVIAVMG